MAIYLGNNTVGTNAIFTTGSGGSVNVSALNVTENGTYTAPAGNAYSPVSVAVPTVLKRGVLRPDATKIQTYTFDQMLVEDMGVELSAYSTSSKTLFDGTNADNALSPTLTLAAGDGYDYFVVMRTLTIPEYSVTTLAKGRQEYVIGAAAYEFVQMPANTMYSLDGSHKTYTSRLAGWTGAGCYRVCYWSSATAVSVSTTGSYGVQQTFNAPSQSNATCTIRPPSIIIRGSTTYFVNTFYNALTDARIQYVIDVYRAPKNNLNYDSWCLLEDLLHANDCSQSVSKTLT